MNKLLNELLNPTPPKKKDICDWEGMEDEIDGTERRHQAAHAQTMAKSNNYSIMSDDETEDPVLSAIETAMDISAARYPADDALFNALRKIETEYFASLIK